MSHALQVCTGGPEREEWWRGVLRYENIKRNLDDCLDRDSGDKRAWIEWVVKVREGEMITRVVVRVESTVSKKGRCRKASVEWKLSGGDISVPVSPGTELDTNQLAGASQISLQATLSGGHWNDIMLFKREGDRGEKPDTQFKLLVYFTKSGTEQDMNPSRKTGLLNRIKRLLWK